MALPALARGLILLEELIRRPEGLRYRDLKNALPDVGDASLNRLLSSLMETGHARKENGLYFPSDKVTHWITLGSRKRDFRISVKDALNDLSRETGESCGLALYDGEKISINHSISLPDSIGVIGEGNILHYEWDHAAALAVLDLLDVKERDSALESPWSRSSREEWKRGRKLFFRDDHYADLSDRRPGVSRLALPWTDGDKRGALFLCLTTERLNRDGNELLEALKAAWDKLGNLENCNRNQGAPG